MLNNMKKLFALVVVSMMAIPFLAGCGESTTQVKSKDEVIQVDSSGKSGKKGAMENDKGLNN